MTSLDTPLADTACTLRDGRTMAYAVWGDPDGDTVLLCHGAPGSRLFAPDAVTTAQAGVRLVTVDRPGYGGSDAHGGRTLLDWPIDVLHLADRLEATRFAVVGHSSGGPYALACARELPDRVSGVAVVSSVAPYEDRPADAPDDDEALTGLVRHAPERAAVQVADGAAWLVHGPDRFLDLPRPEPDAVLLADPASAACSRGPFESPSNKGSTLMPGTAWLSASPGASPSRRSPQMWPSGREARTWPSRRHWPPSWPGTCPATTCALSPERATA